MENLIAGVKKFQRDVFPRHRALFQQLASGQSPDVLVITCSDSRVDPNLLMPCRPARAAFSSFAMRGIWYRRSARSSVA
jgi:carbonic anhydrase